MCKKCLWKCLTYSEYLIHIFYHEDNSILVEMKWLPLEKQMIMQPELPL